jgi:hypothetical protein
MKISNRKKSKILDLFNSSYLGKIVSIDDPEKIGRCKIMVYGVYGDENQKLSNISVEDIPYAYPLNSSIFGKNGCGSFSTPKTNQIVRVIFDGDQYHPRYWSVEDLDDDLLTLLKESYENFHALLVDSEEKLKIYYSKKSGLLMNLDDSLMNILPDNSILIDHKGSSSTIELRGNNMTIKTNGNIDMSSQNNITINSNFVHANGINTDIGANPIFSSMNGEIAMKLLLALGTAIDAKLPLSPGVNSGLVTNMEQLILSKTVKVSP